MAGTERTWIERSIWTERNQRVGGGSDSMADSVETRAQYL